MDEWQRVTELGAVRAHLLLRLALLTDASDHSPLFYMFWREVPLRKCAFPVCLTLASEQTFMLPRFLVTRSHEQLRSVFGVKRSKGSDEKDVRVGSASETRTQLIAAFFTQSIDQESLTSTAWLPGLNLGLKQSFTFLFVLQLARSSKS